VPHAYALIPDPNSIGRFRALHLTDLRVDPSQIEYLEPSARTEPAVSAVTRLMTAMNVRLYQRKLGGWGKKR
jgi:hypothetical protein